MSTWTVTTRTTTLRKTRESSISRHYNIADPVNSYSDDEDVSWKIRRSAAKVIAAVIGTRNELLVEAYKTAAPVLISRFGEREESVRLEILTAFEALLKQTAAARSADTSSQRNKRKRSQEMDEDEDGLPEDS